LNGKNDISQLADIGVTGLADMGANLARNAARKGFRVAVHNRSPEKTDRLIADHGKERKFVPSHSVEDFVASLSKPRAIIIMVKAGKPTDDVIAELVPHLDEGDIIIDAGKLEHRDFDGVGWEAGEQFRNDVKRGWPALLGIYGDPIRYLRWLQFGWLSSGLIPRALANSPSSTTKNRAPEMWPTRPYEGVTMRGR
jgi:hypothetical protein